MDLREERQRNLVAEPVSALVAVTRPIIAGVLHSVGEEYLVAHGGRKKLRLADLGRVRKAGDGDCGIAFEYAVHDAVINGKPIVMERVTDALALCRITQGDPSSILFAIEKTGSKQLVATKRELITTESRILTGKVGQPAKLRKHLNQLAAAFHRPTTRLALPRSIRGLWKADLFLGSQRPDHWVGTSVKINSRHLEAAPGLRVAILPTQSGRSDSIRKDEQKNLVVCPLPHDFSFMQTFYEGMRIVQVMCATDFKMPKEVELPSPQHREVARIYAERREFAVQDVLDATAIFAQPELLEASTETTSSEEFDTSKTPDTNTVITPFAVLEKGGN